MHRSGSLKTSEALLKKAANLILRKIAFGAEDRRAEYTHQTFPLQKVDCLFLSIT